MLKSWIKEVFKSIPGLLELTTALLARVRLKRRFGTMSRRVRQQIYDTQSPIKVKSGYFEGLLYFDKAVWGIITNKWLGSYEHELTAVIEKIMQRQYVRVVDVGCAEGWYLVGLASKLPNSLCYGFDIDPISRWQCHKLAKINHVQDRIKIRTNCSWADLQALCGSETLLICDIEGGETTLLCPKQSPALLKTDILVEVHEACSGTSDVSDLLKSRFNRSHQIQKINPVKSIEWAERNEYLFQGRLSRSELAEAANEHRADGNHWLWLKARSDS